MVLTDAEGKPAGVSFLPEGEASLRAHAVLPRARVYYAGGASGTSSVRRVAWDGMDVYHVVAHGVPGRVEVTTRQGHKRLLSGKDLVRVLAPGVQEWSDRHPEAGRPDLVMHACNLASFPEGKAVVDLLGDKQPGPQELVDALAGVVRAVFAPDTEIGVGPVRAGDTAAAAEDVLLLGGPRAVGVYVKFRPRPDAGRIAELARLTGTSPGDVLRVVWLLRLLFTADVDDRADYESLVRAVAMTDRRRRTDVPGLHGSVMMFEQIVGYLAAVPRGPEPLADWAGEGLADLVPALRSLVGGVEALVGNAGTPAQAWVRRWLPEHLIPVRGPVPDPVASPHADHHPIAVPAGKVHWLSARPPAAYPAHSLHGGGLDTEWRKVRWLPPREKPEAEELARYVLQLDDSRFQNAAITEKHYWQLLFTTQRAANILPHVTDVPFRDVLRHARLDFLRKVLLSDDTASSAALVKGDLVIPVPARVWNRTAEVASGLDLNRIDHGFTWAEEWMKPSGGGAPVMAYYYRPDVREPAPWGDRVYPVVADVDPGDWTITVEALADGHAVVLTPPEFARLIAMDPERPSGVDIALVGNYTADRHLERIVDTAVRDFETARRIERLVAVQAEAFGFTHRLEITKEGYLAPYRNPISSIRLGRWVRSAGIPWEDPSRYVSAVFTDANYRPIGREYTAGEHDRHLGPRRELGSLRFFSIATGEKSFLFAGEVPWIDKTAYFVGAHGDPESVTLPLRDGRSENVTALISQLKRSRSRQNLFARSRSETPNRQTAAVCLICYAASFPEKVNILKKENRSTLQQMSDGLKGEVDVIYGANTIIGVLRSYEAEADARNYMYVERDNEPPMIVEARPMPSDDELSGLARYANDYVPETRWVGVEETWGVVYLLRLLFGPDVGSRETYRDLVRAVVVTDVLRRTDPSGRYGSADGDMWFGDIVRYVQDDKYRHTPPEGVSELAFRQLWAAAQSFEPKKAFFGKWVDMSGNRAGRLSAPSASWGVSRSGGGAGVVSSGGPFGVRLGGVRGGGVGVEVGMRHAGGVWTSITDDVNGGRLGALVGELPGLGTFWREDVAGDGRDGEVGVVGLVEGSEEPVGWAGAAGRGRVAFFAVHGDEGAVYPVGSGGVRVGVDGGEFARRVVGPALSGAELTGEDVELVLLACKSGAGVVGQQVADALRGVVRGVWAPVGDVTVGADQVVGGERVAVSLSVGVGGGGEGGAWRWFSPRPAGVVAVGGEVPGSVPVGSAAGAVAESVVAGGGGMVQGGVGNGRAWAYRLAEPVGAFGGSDRDGVPAPGFSMDGDLDAEWDSVPGLPPKGSVDAEQLARYVLRLDTDGFEEVWINEQLYWQLLFTAKHASKVPDVELTPDGLRDVRLGFLKEVLLRENLTSPATLGSADWFAARVWGRTEKLDGLQSGALNLSWISSVRTTKVDAESPDMYVGEWREAPWGTNLYPVVADFDPEDWTFTVDRQAVGHAVVLTPKEAALLIEMDPLRPRDAEVVLAGNYTAAEHMERLVSSIIHREVFGFTNRIEINSEGYLVPDPSVPTGRWVRSGGVAWKSPSDPVSTVLTDRHYMPVGRAFRLEDHDETGPFRDIASFTTYSIQKAPGKFSSAIEVPWRDKIVYFVDLHGSPQEVEIGLRSGETQRGGRALGEELRRRPSLEALIHRNRQEAVPRKIAVVLIQCHAASWPYGKRANVLGSQPLAQEVADMLAGKVDVVYGVNAKVYPWHIYIPGWEHNLYLVPNPGVKYSTS
ncbi:MAG: hypothetical protein JF597_09160 [Streptomyces sp.]|uniref:hypothetical protein n=1 Tax=Streptomyces sp. TaxID=1931 RepID=UPI0025D98512|nr:hypothetical protein [Streptomyces sp.]MBW8793742.1 hypothetical protein [Streptomyces sp.]